MHTESGRTRPPLEAMHRYALAVDTKDWAALEQVFCPDVTADFRSFGARQVFTGSSTEWVATIRSTLDGMDATQHAMSNHLYAVDGDRANGTTYIQARHVCKNDWGGDTYTVGGHYAVELRLLDNEWRIERYTLHCTWHEGDRHVLKAAARRMA